MAISDVTEAVRRGGPTALRRGLDRALGRLRAGIWPVAQTAVAAALAWSMAVVVLGNDRPFVAAIAAVISIGAVAGQTLKRAIEWTLGVAVGLTVADLIMLAIGTGPVQIGVIVGLAMAVALLIRGGIMFWTEAGVSALLVAGLDPMTSGVSPDRLLEALMGGGVALAVSAAFPSNPSLRAKLATQPVLDDLATALRDSSAALIGGDIDLAEQALSEARCVDASVARLREELDGGYQIARFAPPRRRHLGPLAHYATAADQLDFAVRDTRVLARAAVTMVRERGASDGQLPEAILGLALAVEALAGYLERPDFPVDVRHFALGAAEEATATLRTNNDLESSALVAQIRSTALDLLQAAGMGPAEALEALRNPHEPASEPSVAVR
ncbi:aromatic acid exporter family protein [Rubrobacter tropicus]|uniref:Aromatic acid exporter family protein n=1 Tax=Rubrobacter tropicus TaxID=2653851 RepID=A0A6G8Q6W4_9ACTN|nr:FUSC family protein [Rubrobacter tropicus]QIN82206.1 aromatic acid exporter family protein [Rubrobacter tropicus]